MPDMIGDPHRVDLRIIRVLVADEADDFLELQQAQLVVRQGADELDDPALDVCPAQF